MGLAGIPGEYLTWTNPKLEVKPWLATSWKPNKDLTVWTFQLRKNVKFHNGKTMNADDVVASIRQYITLKDSQALGALPPSMIEPSGVVKTGPYTVQFRLKQANNAFPYLVSQTTYQAIIQPAAIAAKPGTWVSSGMIGTGAFRAEEPEQAARRARSVQQLLGWQGAARRLNDHVLRRPRADGARTAGRQLDLVVQMSPSNHGLSNNSRYKVYTAPNSSHNMFGMRVDREPFRDARVRRAVALTLNRPDIINRVLLGAGTLGDDSPFCRGSRRPTRRSSSANRTSSSRRRC